jgi:hypothetical protein
MLQLHWTTKAGPPRTHYGARANEHPRYYVRRERRWGTLFWVVYYRLGGLTDAELGSAPNTLDEAKRQAELDLEYRVAMGSIQSLGTEATT